MKDPWTQTMDGNRTDYGSGEWAGLRGRRGKKWDNCNSINNKIL